MDSHAALYELGKKRLAQLREMKPLRDESFQQKLESHGISRRDFMIWSATITSLLALPMPFNTMVAEAAELADRVPLIWLSMAECTGCSESFTRTTTPDISTILFEHVSLEYQEVLMAAAGMQAEENLDNAIKNYKGKYLLAVEGAIPTANNGTFLTIGNKTETGVDLIKRVTKDAAAIMCVGTCSSFGGVQAASPNPTGAKGVGAVVDLPVINVAGCPPNPANITGTLMYYIMFGRLPALDIFNRPKWAYGARVHDNCERRGHFDAGEFVLEFGDDNAKNGFCLFKMGCKGPYTFNNCPTERFNAHTSWPVLAGHGCIGCSEPDFWDDMADFEKPLSRKPLHGLDATADTIGAVTLGLTAVGIGAHAVSSIFAKKVEE
ncbi:Quinone-reactive Ni/Fe-hydrogenase small chain precursor [Photobacterium damselae subsp. piscicida]|uniref:hydrogenase (acceptor) n=2 Tax=Photobacterium damselae TaxID=38293 RepID=L7NJT1_PHODP|nr:hydrogenase small subunit [Photobacterium damselae]AEU09914.1 quinone-reactive Ni/Fe hydrogenase, small subunit precursor [Photobacterium damselae subsp. piscicida]MBE8129164.1 hydrogenase small subunit [Photobacterium damselae subsp. piscicida]MDP2514129.1 hydrogenase small subunit [Photobacterium damselae subsp. piscicida]MDP2532691.1 hydrogenase small subunit [Photobacterium damselae subsp. piscicida]MDP2544574.1 hydrogenase small subunit [Photobacterium damselae subsp. piscicida]